MNLHFHYSKQVLKFCKKNPHLIREDTIDELCVRAIQKILKLKDVNCDVVNLSAPYNGKFRVRDGDIRVIFSFLRSKNDITLQVSAVDFRGNIYK